MHHHVTDHTPKVSFISPLARIALVGIFVLAGGMFVSTSAFADDDGAIKYRKAVMKSIGGHMGAMAGIMKKTGGTPAHLKAHADGMASLSKMTADLFPDGSEFGDTTALPVIWEKPDEFKQAVQDFETAAAHLAQVAGSGDMAAFGPAFGQLGKTCKGCHENFREKKE